MIMILSQVKDQKILTDAKHNQYKLISFIIYTGFPRE